MVRQAMAFLVGFILAAWTLPWVSILIAALIGFVFGAALRPNCP